MGKGFLRGGVCGEGVDEGLEVGEEGAVVFGAVGGDVGGGVAGVAHQRDFFAGDFVGGHGDGSFGVMSVGAELAWCLRRL